ncbi:ABC transporter ATP-binding protein [Streptomyces calidiresistens]|uniref:ABC-type quaternary amine transporter n=1 Tax=Streptomyces calidiresistens TaxID=1485586 RepID=A0A7W3XWU4_9ACTN|nr:ATP-binding cassette domain-containing protein [Streptomyces calidiresistens]MBB0230229.1 ATP-binding cassette domain-containing protein [Streptomyces calidiresistens]
MNDLSVRGLVKSHGSDGPVLRGLDLHAGAGDLVAVLGPSGCGKTTLLRVIAGFLRADAGTVTVGGRVLTAPGTHVPPERRAVGIVAQEGALFPHLDVARNVAFGLTDLSRAERRRRVAEMLDLVGLAEHGRRMPHELSGGQQQRVSLARALAPRPALVLLDEPFNALDSSLRHGLRADVRAALRAGGATALLVTHDQQEALSVADSVAVVRDGRVVQQDDPRRLYHHPVDARVARFVGDAVVLPGTVEGAAGDRAGTPLGEIRLPGDASAGPAGPVGPGTPVTVLLRPEQLLLRPPGTAVGGTVEDVHFYGHDAVVTVRVAGLERPVEVRHAGAVEVRPGDPTGLVVTGPALLCTPGAVPEPSAVAGAAR